MIYTIGYARHYDANLKRRARFMKIGERPDYPGGFAFKTPLDGWIYCVEAGKKGYAVYEVEADWKKDTAPSVALGGWWNRLLKDSRVIRKIRRPHNWRQLVREAIRNAPPVEGDPG